MSTPTEFLGHVFGEIPNAGGAIIKREVFCKIDRTPGGAPEGDYTVTFAAAVLGAFADLDITTNAYRPAGPVTVSVEPVAPGGPTLTKLRIKVFKVGAVPVETDPLYFSLTVARVPRIQG